MKSFKILQLCAKPPRPKVDGGCIAMNAITVGLSHEGHEVHTIAIRTDKHPGDTEQAAKLNKEIASYRELYVDTRVRTISALVNLLKGRSYNISRFESNDVKQIISEALENESFDIVIFESLFMLPYLDVVRRNSDAKTVLRAHNVEHRIWEGLAEDAGSRLKSWYLRVLAKQLRKYEINHLNEVDAIVPITEEDASELKSLGATVPIHASPFGMEFDEPTEQSPVDHVFHFGSMDWKPNQDGVRWLCDEVWPKVREENNSAQLVLAGRHMPSSFKSNQAKGIQVVGEVEYAWEFLQRPGIMTIPVHSGSGMRIKAIEGMSAGRPLVSTTLGAAGLGLTHGLNALIADSSYEFAQAILLLLKEEGEIGTKGNNFVRDKFSLHSVSNKLTTFFSSI